MAGKTKNLILLQDLPPVSIGGIMYTRPKGTVYGWNTKDKEWNLVAGDPDGRNCCIEQCDLDGKGADQWYKLTTKKPTYKAFKIAGHTVKILKTKKKVEVGCNTVTYKEIDELHKLIHE